MNYIGIRGHRGAGKASIAFLLGQTIETLHRFPNLSDISFEERYMSWCKLLMDDPNNTYGQPNHHVYYESFSFNIEFFIKMLLSCPEEYLEDDMKDDIIVNVKDLTYCDRGSWKGSKLITAQEMFNKIDADSQPQNITGNYSMTMREFILYFGMEVMQRYFGRNVWVNVAKADAAEYDKMIDNGNSYRIYKDLKTSAEAQFIHSLNGVIVKVIRPSNKKSTSGLDIVSHDTNADYILEVKGDLYSTMDDVKRLAKDIISRFK